MAWAPGPMLRALLCFGAWMAARGACPGAGAPAHGRCWYLSEPGASCAATCEAQGLAFSLSVAGEAAPMTPRLLGREPANKQFAWGRLECFVPSGDRYHPAKAVPSSDTGDVGGAGDWTVDICRLACPCAERAGDAAAYPGCVQQGEVLRHAGAHAIFVDLSSHGSSGCWQNDCTNTDKFAAADAGVCARACAEAEACSHWTFGEQDGARRCFLRKSDAGREPAEGWAAAPKSCAPPALPDAVLARAAGQLLVPCDGGKSEGCPDMARAVTTWRFAIRHLKRATEGRLDASTINFINQISGDTDAFAAQMSEENFGVVAANNRQVFQALHSWLESQPGTEVDQSDASLPNPLRGKLCGPSHCFEEL